jgi:hypothetical protein
MSEDRQRRVVVEVERMQLIRKWIRTRVFECGSCKRDVDFVTVSDAIRLFEISAAELNKFMSTNGSHSKLSTDEVQHICLTSLLAGLNRSNNKHEVKLFLGGKK